MSNHSDISFISASATPAAGNGVVTTAPSAPSGIAAGMLLIGVLGVSMQGTSAAAQPDFSAPSGWANCSPESVSNPLVNQSSSAGSALQFIYRWATGSDTMPSWDFSTGSDNYKYASTVLCYSPIRLGAGDSYNIPMCHQTAILNGTSSTSLVTPGGTVDGNKKVVIVAVTGRSTTNASLSTPSGLTLRSSKFGSGGAAADLGVYDYGAELGGAFASKTITAGTAESWGVSGYVKMTVRNFIGPGIPMF